MHIFGRVEFSKKSRPFKIMYKTKGIKAKQFKDTFLQKMLQSSCGSLTLPGLKYKGRYADMGPQRLYPFIYISIVILLGMHLAENWGRISVWQQKTTEDKNLLLRRNSMEAKIKDSLPCSAPITKWQIMTPQSLTLRQSTVTGDGKFTSHVISLIYDARNKIETGIHFLWEWSNTARRGTPSSSFSHNLHFFFDRGPGNSSQHVTSSREQREFVTNECCDALHQDVAETKLLNTTASEADDKVAGQQFSQKPLLKHQQIYAGASLTGSLHRTSLTELTRNGWENNKHTGLPKLSLSAEEPPPQLYADNEWIAPDVHVTQGKSLEKTVLTWDANTRRTRTRNTCSVSKSLLGKLIGHFCSNLTFLHTAFGSDLIRMPTILSERNEANISSVSLLFSVIMLLGSRNKGKLKKICDGLSSITTFKERLCDAVKSLQQQCSKECGGNELMRAGKSIFYQASSVFSRTTPLLIHNLFAEMSTLKDEKESTWRCKDFASLPTFIPCEKDELRLASYFSFDFFTVPRQKACVFPATGLLPDICNSQKDIFSQEGFRLASLNHLPVTCNVSRIRLAQAGFYYDTNKVARDASSVDEVVCYSCGLRCAKWEEGDNPVSVHRELSPDCPHLKCQQPDMNPLPASFACQESSATTVSTYQERTCETTGPSALLRASSRDPASTHLPAFHLGNATSIFSGNTSSESDLDSLETDCAATLPSEHLTTPTGQSAPSSLQGADIASRLSQHSRHADIFRKDASRTSASVSDDRPSVSLGYAAYPHFATSQSRLATFQRWPLAHVFPPQSMVSYGFYYAGYADCLRCFYCGVGLKNWDLHQDVLTEHIRWRPQCGFLLATKGKQFVLSTLARIQESSRNQTNQNNIFVNTTTATTSLTTPSQAVLVHLEEMGFPKEIIETAILEMTKSGSSTMDVDALLECILEISSRNDVTSRP